MPREGVPYPERVLCSLKNTITMIEQKLGLKIEKINGVGPDPSGNVTIVSDDAAITVEEDAAQHQVTIGLDRAELPSAAVTSVNGETGAVVLDASEIPYNDPDGYTDDVDEKLNVLTGVQNALQLSINQERTRAQNAESGLQTNINALAATVPESSITPDPLKVVMRDSSGRGYAADPENGATDKSLVTANWISQTGDSAPNNVLHKTGSESSIGTKTFTEIHIPYRFQRGKTWIYNNGTRYLRACRWTTNPGVIIRFNAIFGFNTAGRYGMADVLVSSNFCKGKYYGTSTFNMGAFYIANGTDGYTYFFISNVSGYNGVTIEITNNTRYSQNDDIPGFEMLTESGLLSPPVVGDDYSSVIQGSEI